MYVGIFLFTSPGKHVVFRNGTKKKHVGLCEGQNARNIFGSRDGLNASDMSGLGSALCIWYFPISSLDPFDDLISVT